MLIRDLIWLLSQPMFWAILGVVFGPYLFFRGFRVLQLKRAIMNVPRSTVRAAAMGQVEIRGKALGPYTLVAPMSHSDCLYYRLHVESNPSGDLKTTIHELCAPLFLDDGTGIVMVYPQGAELKMAPSSQRAEYGKLVVALSTRYRTENPEFAQEYSIRPGDSIFVLGTLRENIWKNRHPYEGTEDLARIGPGFICDGEADLQRREAFPFLDPTRPAGAVIVSTQQFDLNPPVILMKGSGPFVISTDSEVELLSKLSWKSWLFIWGGPIAALWGLWEILNKFGWLGLGPQN
jgi:hypothetical protein